MYIFGRYARRMAILSFFIVLSVGVIAAENNETGVSNNMTSNDGSNLIDNASITSINYIGADQWVMITNQGTSDINLSGWKLTDKENQTYSFPVEFSLKPGAVVRVHTGIGENTSTDLYNSPLTWNKSGDTAILKDAFGKIVSEMAQNATENITQNKIESIKQKNETESITQNAQNKTGNITQITQNETKNIVPVMAQNTTVTGNITPIMAQNVTVGITQNATENVTQNAIENATENITQNEIKSVISASAQNATVGITQNATENVTQNATKNIMLANIPQINIIQPKKDSSIHAGNVKIAVAVKNFTVVDKQGQANAAGEGHIHYFMDVKVPTTSGEPSVTANGTYVQETNKSYIWKNIKPGKHNFSVELVNNDHTPLTPPAVNEINVTVTSAVNVTANKTSATATNKTLSQNKTPIAARNATENITQKVTRNITPAKISSKAAIVNIAAKKLAFNTSTITVPAGAKVTINFDNRDNGIYHNIAIYTDASAKKSIYVGMPVIGRSIIAYIFNAPSTPGTYFFQDNKNPTTMKGQFIVK